MSGMTWKDMLLAVILILFTVICAGIGGYYRYIEMDNQIKLHDALESGRVTVNP